MAEFYSARGWEIPPLPWTNLSPPFSCSIQPLISECHLSSFYLIEFLEHLFRWLPRCRKPALVFRIYQSTPLPNELESTRLAAAQDLRYLNPPLGLSREQFDDAVRALLRTLPVFQELLALVETDGLRNGIGRKVVDKIYAVSDGNFESERSWSNIREWLIHFFRFRAEPHEYRIVAGTQDD